jgi:hypothetical protein
MDRLDLFSLDDVQLWFGIAFVGSYVVTMVPRFVAGWDYGIWCALPQHRRLLLSWRRDVEAVPAAARVYNAARALPAQCTRLWSLY